MREHVKVTLTTPYHSLYTGAGANAASAQHTFAHISDYRMRRSVLCVGSVSVKLRQQLLDLELVHQALELTTTRPRGNYMTLQRVRVSALYVLSISFTCHTCVRVAAPKKFEIVEYCIA